MTSARRSRRSASRVTDAELRLDKGIYTEAAIERACRAFSHLAQIRVRSSGGRWSIRFTEIRPEIAARLADEFANHALSCLMVDR